MHVSNNEITYFDSFGVECDPKEIWKFIGHKNIKTSIFRIQENDSIMCGYFCIWFIDFIFAGRTLIEYTSLFSPYNFERNDNIIRISFEMNEINLLEAINTYLNDKTPLTVKKHQQNWRLFYYRNKSERSDG